VPHLAIHRFRQYRVAEAQERGRAVFRFDVERLVRALLSLLETDVHRTMDDMGEMIAGFASDQNRDHIVAFLLQLGADTDQRLFERRDLRADVDDGY
jgi:hypothetical protein